MEDSLPGDVWMIILRYIPFHERMESVQYVNKRLHDLCWACLSTDNLNFESAIYMDEKLCLKVVRKVKSTVSNLCFKDCHWFPAVIFRKFPELPSLISLDVRRCFLSGAQLFHLMKNAPNLKNLAISVSQRELDFLSKKSDTLSDAWPLVHLERLHIHIYKKSRVSHDDANFANLKPMKIFSLFFPESVNPPKSLSVELDGMSLNWNFPESEHTLDFGDYIGFPFRVYLLDNNEIFCSRLFSTGLHAKDAGGSLEYDWSKIKFLSLPHVPNAPDGTYIPGCEHGSSIFPEILPDLEYLNMSITWNPSCGFACYETTKQHILLDCEYPNLKYLRLGHGSSYNGPPVEFYHKLATLKYLTELNLRTSVLDMNMLIGEISGLSLQSLSLCLNDTVCGGGAAVESSGNGVCAAANSFFEKLVMSFPLLQKLEIFSVCSENPGTGSLSSLSNLPQLEALSLNGFQVNNSVAFAAMLRDLTRLRSFSLVHLDESLKNCKYKDLLLRGLRYLPNLMELRLMHDDLDYFEVFSGVLKCKRLEKIVLRGLESGEAPSREDMWKHYERVYNLFKEANLTLPRLHMFAMISSRMNDRRIFFEHGILGYFIDNKRSCGLELYCGEPPSSWGRGHGVSCVFYHFIGTKYDVMQHTAYDFPYSRK